MHFALAGQQRFAGARVLAHGDGRVFFLKTGQAGEDLFFVAGLLGVHGHGDGRRRELDGFELDGLAGFAQRVAGAGILQLGQRADVARDQLIHNDLLLAAHDEQVAGLFSFIRVGVIQRGGGGQRAGAHLEQAHLADELVDDGLEHDRGERIGFLAFAGFHIAALGVGAFDLAAGRRGHVGGEHVEHRGHADSAQTRAAADRNDGTIGNADAQAAEDFFLGQLAFFEVLLHQFFVGAGDGFHNFFARGGDHFFFAGGQRNFLHGLAGGFVGFLFKHVHNALEAEAFAQRQQDRHYFGAELAAQGFEGLMEIGVLAIHLVDDEAAHDAVLCGERPRFFRADGHAGNGADDDGRAFAYAHRAHHFADEIEVAGHVDEVDLLALPFDGRNGGGNGNAAAGFFGVKVGDGVAVFHAARTVDRAGGEEHGLDQRGFAFAAVSDDDDVANIFGLVLFHPGNPPVLRCLPLFAKRVNRRRKIYVK